MPSHQHNTSQSMSDPNEDDVTVINTSQSQEVLSTQLLQAPPLTVKLNVNNATTMATNHLGRQTG